MMLLNGLPWCKNLTFRGFTIAAPRTKLWRLGTRTAFANPSYRTSYDRQVLHVTLYILSACYDRYLHCQRKVTAKITKEHTTGLRPS